MTEKEVEITVSKGEEIIIKEERGLRIWRISADYTDYTDLKSFNDNIFFYLHNLRNLWISCYL